MENEVNTPDNEKSLEQLLAEAEERGYRRGIEENIARPGVWEPADATDPAHTPPATCEFRILDGPRRSIWD